MIRRYAFAAVQKAFQENGIEFATPKVELIFDEDDDNSREQTGEPSQDRDKTISGAAASQAVKLADGSTG